MKILLLILSVVIILFSSSPIVQAYDVVETEPNNTFDYPMNLSFDSVISVKGYFNYSYDDDWFRFYANQAGVYSVSLTNGHESGSGVYGLLPADYDVYIFGPSNNYSYAIAWSEAAGNSPEQAFFYVSSPGYYYVWLSGWGDWSTTTPYNLTIARGDAAMLIDGLRYTKYIRSYIPRKTQTDWNNTTAENLPVAYAYGIKDDFLTFGSQLDNTNNGNPPASYSNYLVRPMKWSTDSGTTYTGIDCSGFVQRTAAYSHKNNTSQQRYTLPGPPDWINANTIGSDTHSTLIYSPLVTTYSDIRVGDLFHLDSHIGFVSVPATNKNNVRILHAHPNDNGQSFPMNRRIVSDAYLSYYYSTAEIRRLIVAP